MDKLYEILDKVVLGDERTVLATIIKVEGSAYRKAGASVLFTEAGQQIGVISIGCLEEDLAIRANALLQHPTHQSARIAYDMSSEDDLGWGRGVGCNGKIHILLEKVTTELRENLMDVYAKLQKGMEVIAIKDLRSIPYKIKTTYQADRVRARNKKTKQMVLNQRLNQFIDKKFYHYFPPKSRLFIFGAGKDVEPLAKLAVQNDFSVFIWDWRQAHLCTKKFPHVNFIQNLDTIAFTETDSVVIMTHDYQKDKEILNEFLSSDLQYFGILGPRKRTERLIGEKEIPSHIHSPVGLQIGAEGPNEIAVSIIADIIRVKRGAEKLERRENSWNLSSGREKQQIWRH